MVDTQMKNSAMTLKIIVSIRIKGYLGIPKGMSKAPQMVLIVERKSPKRPAHRYMLMFDFYLS